MQYPIINFDFIYLSFDEPNAEELYADLLNHVPWAKRVHGVKGFDAAHRACADASDTDFFVTVDGDNKIYPEFLDLKIEISDDQYNHAWTWAGRNNVNGLVYGNGGLKLWSKEFVRSMHSHENATSKGASVDFCWHANYHEAYGCYSTNTINGSQYQAWRSGFREGAKMSLDRGSVVDPKRFHSSIWHGNIDRLSIWASVGQDVEHGIWSIYGARLGCQMTALDGWNYSFISDYQQMQDLWNTVKDTDPIERSLEIGKRLQSALGLDISLLSATDSKFFKSVYMNPPYTRLPSDQIDHYMAVKNV
jgi:hypothetical protein